MTKRVDVQLDKGVLTLRPLTTQIEDLNEAYHLLKDESSREFATVKLDLRTAPSDVALSELRPFGELLGTLISGMGAKLVVLIQPDDSTGKILGALVAQSGGRVLTTSDPIEARDWIDQKLI